METLLDRAKASNAKIAAQIADFQAALSDAQAALTKTVMAIPGATAEFARSAVVAARAGGAPVSLGTLDLAFAGGDVSERMQTKEIMIKLGQVRT